MPEKKWFESGKCLIWIFNVGRGFCAFVRTPNKLGIMIDCGSSEDFSPAEFVKKNLVRYLSKYSCNQEKYPIAQLFISHPHTDHFTDIANVAPSDEKSILRPCLLTCPNDKGKEKEWEKYSGEALNFERVKNMVGTDDLIKQYKEMYRTRNLPLHTISQGEYPWPEFEYGYYYIRPTICENLYPKNKDDPKADLNYVNSTSLVVYFRYGINTILFPGDMPDKAMNYLLDEREGCEKRFTRFFTVKSNDEITWSETTTDQPPLKALLEFYGLTMLVAPHHGLESGYSDYLFECMRDRKPGIVLISEKRHKAPQDGSIAKEYQTDVDDTSLSVSVEDDDGNIKEEQYSSVSTRKNHHILVSIPSIGDPKIMLRKTPDAMLTEF